MDALAYRAVHDDRQRHRVAIFSELRQVKLDPALDGRLARGEFLYLVSVVVQGAGGPGPEPRDKRPDAGRTRLAAVQSSHHDFLHPPAASFRAPPQGGDPESTTLG